MELRQLLDFKIKKISKIDVKDLASLVECIGEYLKKAENENIKVHHVLKAIHCNTSGGTWFLYKGSNVIGFLSGGIIKTVYDEHIYVVDSIYVGKEGRFIKHAKQLVEMAMAWAKQMGVPKIMCSTSRNPQAFCRFFSKDAKIESILSLSLEEHI